jgi:hypothetical protein
MALLPGNTPKRTRFRLVDVMPKGTMGGGNEKTTVGDGLDVPVKLYIPTAQSVDAFEVLNPSEVVLFAVDKNGNVKQGGVTGSSQFAIQVTLTAAQLIAMYAAPVAIILALAAGSGIAVDQAVFQMKATATAFTGGGIVTLQYGVTAHGAGTLVHAGSVPAAVVTAGAGSSLTNLGPAAAANGTTVPTDGTTASGIYISNATAPFAAGTGTAIVTIYGSYVTQG